MEGGIEGVFISCLVATMLTNPAKVNTLCGNWPGPDLSAQTLPGWHTHLVLCGIQAWPEQVVVAVGKPGGCVYVISCDFSCPRKPRKGVCV